MVDYLNLKSLGSCLEEVNAKEQKLYIVDLSFNTSFTDELLVVYFNCNKDIVSIAH